MDKATCFCVGNWLVEPDKGLISNEKRSRKLPRKVMLLLCELAQYPNETVTREHLLNTIWPGRVGADESLSSAVSSLRKSLLDDTPIQQHIKTVPKIGYVLVAPVDLRNNETARDSSAQPGFESTIVKRKTRTNSVVLTSILAGLVLLAVMISLPPWQDSQPTSVKNIETVGLLPVISSTQDTNQRAIVNGLLRLVANNFSTGNIRPVLVSEASSLDLSSMALADLFSITNADALLKTSISVIRDTPILDLMLVTRNDSTPVWQQQFPLDSELHESVISELQTEMTRLNGPSQNSQGLPYTLPAIDKLTFLKAVEFMNRLSPDKLFEAQAIFEAALAKVPDHGLTKLNLAFTLIRQVNWGQLDEQTGFHRAQSLLKSLNPSELPAGRYNMVRGFLYAPKAIANRFADSEKSATFFEKSLSESPLDTQIILFASTWYLSRTDPQRAENLLQRAITLSPMNPNLYSALGAAHLYAGDLTKAKSVLSHVTKTFPENADSYLTMAVMQQWFTNRNIPDISESINYIVSCLNRNPYAMDCWGFLVENLASNGEADLAAKAMQKARSYSPALATEWALMQKIVVNDLNGAVSIAESVEPTELLSSFAHPLILYVNAKLTSPSFSNEIGQYLDATLSGRIGSTKKLYKAQRLLREGQSDEANLLLKSIIEQLSTSQAIPGYTRLKIAEAHALLGNHPQAFEMLFKITEDYKVQRYFFHFYELTQSPFLAELHRSEKWREFTTKLQKQYDATLRTFPMEPILALINS